MNPIGVFDSGVGGLSILRALQAELPHEDFVYLGDSGYAPYGERGDAYVIDRTRTIVGQMRRDYGIKALVVACNTATAAAIHVTRAEHPDLAVVVGVEPALKPAVALSKTRRIAVLATRGTLASAKFLGLHDALKGQVHFVLQPCDGLADAIENDDGAKIAALCAEYTTAAGPFGPEPGQADVLVLGCTHYAFAEAQLSALVGPAVRLVETGAPVARQARRLLSAAGQLKTEGDGTVQWLSTGSLAELREAASRWLGR